MGNNKQPRFHRNKQGGMVTLGVSGLLLTVDPASSKRAVKELQILLEPYKDKVEIMEINSDEECEEGDEEDDSQEDEQEQEVLPPVGYGTDTSSSLAAELAAELDGFRGQGRGGDESGGEKRIQMYDDEGNFIMPTDEDEKNNNNHNKKKHTGPRKEKRDWRSEWFSSLETNCKGHIFINIPRKKTKEDIAKEEAKRALKELIDKQYSDAAAAAAAAAGGGDETTPAVIGTKRPREDGGVDNDDGNDAEEEEGGVLDLTALLGGGGAAPAPTAETPAITATEGGTATEVTVTDADGNTTTTTVAEVTPAATPKPVPHQMMSPNLRVPALVDLLLDNLSADPRPVCRFAYRMYPVWATCYPTTATILACCKEIAETTIEIPEGQYAAKVGIHLAIKNNTAVDKEKNYLKAAIESTLVGTRKCIVLPRFSGSNMTIEVDCVMTVMVMHSICCVGIQTKYHSKYGRRGYNLHSFSKGSMNLADSTTPTAAAITAAVTPTPAAPAATATVVEEVVAVPESTETVASAVDVAAVQEAPATTE